MKISLHHLPHAPGVYLMKDDGGRVIYVGKALDLQKRVASYFGGGTQRDLRPAARHLAEEAKSVEFIVTANENEAFILENNLIKKMKPRYNIRLKDDKTFLSVRVDLKHPFPYPVPVRRPRKDGALYFGPYSSSRAVRSTLRLLRTVVPLRDCKDREFAQRRRPCIKYQIGRCPAPCVGKISRQAYRRNLDQALDILQGKVEHLIGELERRMLQASSSMEFEDAARNRDRISHLKSFARTQKVEDLRFFDVDVIAPYRQGGMAEVAVLLYREGKLLSTQPYFFDLDLEEEELLDQFLRRYYDGSRYIPEQVFIPAPVPEMDALKARLQRLRKGPFRLKVARRGAGARLLSLARENARLSFRASRESAEEAARVLAFIGESLGLGKTPSVIEGIDISTTGGREAVGALVCFQDGLPRKSRYRRYRIKTVEGMDDYAMIREVVRRRMKRGLKEDGLPDLVVVDGGIGQLRAAREAALELGVESIDMIGLKKGETRARAVVASEEGADRIVTLREDPCTGVPHGTPAFHLLQRIRDEAHRFAIQYHRQGRNKKGMASPLDNVRGLGAKGKQGLLARFGGLRELKSASREEIGLVAGIGPVLSQRIYQALHE